MKSVVYTGSTCIRRSVACLLGLWLALSAAAQPVTVRSLGSTPQGDVLEVVAQWARPLAAALDSADVTALSWKAVVAATGGAWETSETIWLPAPVTPRVEIV